MSRISDVTDRDQLPEGLRHWWDDIVASRGSVRGPFKVLLHSPELAGRAAHLGTYVRFESEATLPAHVRELAALITARLLDCGYEYSAHRSQAAQAGVSSATLAAIDEKRAPEEDGWLFNFVQQVIERHRVDTSTFEEAQRRLGVQGLVELVGTVGYYAFLAATLNTFEVEPTEI
ncbi:MAG: carboxymuconolactone decarboxylase family protein [Chloroflexota bacterium]